MNYKTFINDLSSNIKLNKKYKTIKSSYFKKKIKIFKKKNTMFLNPNLKKTFRKCSVKEWMIINKKIVNMLNKNYYRVDPNKIIPSLVLTYMIPSYHYLLSSYYHYSSRRIPKIKLKFMDIKFLIKSLILNADEDKDHLKIIKYKLNHIGITNYKFVFENQLSCIDTKPKLMGEKDISDSTKDILQHYLNVNKNKRNFKIYKVRKDFIYDAFLLFFMDLSKYELKQILFYKKNLNYFDYDFEVFVLKKIDNNKH